MCAAGLGHSGTSWGCSVSLGLECLYFPWLVTASYWRQKEKVDINQWLTPLLFNENRPEVNGNRLSLCETLTWVVSCVLMIPLLRLSNAFLFKQLYENSWSIWRVQYWLYCHADSTIWTLALVKDIYVELIFPLQSSTSPFCFILWSHNSILMAT